MASICLMAQTQSSSLDLGSIPVASQSAPVPATFSLVGQSAAPAFSVLYGSDFEIGAASCDAAFATCSVPVTFKPTYPGLRTEVLLVRNQANTLLGRMVLTGTGTGPQASLAQGLVSTLSWGAVGTPVPSGFVIDPGGNVYALNWNSNQIFKLNSATQTVSVIAGSTVAGYSGDGGPAFNAQFSRPVSLALDRNGNLFVADRNNNVIRKIDLATGIITTVVGTGVAGRSDTGPASATPISFPFGLTTDPQGNLYFIEGTDFSDVSDYKVRKVDAATQTLSVFAGTGVAGNTGDDGPATAAQVNPLQLSSDLNGNIYIVQQSGSYNSDGGIVRVVSNGIISRFAGADAGSTGDGAPALSTHFFAIRDITFDAAGNVFFIEGSTPIRKLSPSGSRITSALLSSTLPNFYYFYYPTSLALNADGSFYLSDGFSAPKKVATQAAPLAFANTNAGKISSPLLLTYYNTGNRTLAVGDISIDGANPGDFVQANNCGTDLPSGGSCTITVNFTPQVMGARSGTLTITDSAPGSPRNVSLSGTGLSPQQAVLSPISLWFGPQNGGTVSAPQMVTLSNPGVAPLRISAVTVTNPSFAVSHDCPSSLPAGAQCTISVTFSPSMEGWTNGSKLTVTDDASNSPQSVDIQGFGQAITYAASFSPLSVDLGIVSIHDLGSRQVSIPSVQTISIRNTGTGNLPYFNLQIDGLNASEFSASNNCPTVVGPGSTCTISVAFTPAAAGLRTGNLKIYTYSIVNGLPETVALTGTGYLQPSAVRGASGYLRVSTDFNGDGKSDLAYWRPGTGMWEIAESSNPASTRLQQWGLPGDVPVPGDYDGDGKADIAVWRPSNGMWYVIPSGNPSTSIQQQWGFPGDIPLVCDFDGDGKADFTVWRQSTGTWFVMPSSNPRASYSRQWGFANDIPIPGDFDGDGKADFVVWRPGNGTWYLNPSSDPATTQVRQWGFKGDIPVGVDFDGDGKTDFAVWRPLTGTWWVIPSSRPSVPLSQQWGLSGDIPSPADLDGDGKADFAVWRPSDATWYVAPTGQSRTMYTRVLGGAADTVFLGAFAGDGWPYPAVWHSETGVWTVQTRSSSTTVQQWGLPGDIPLLGDFDGDAKSDLAVWRPSNGTWYVILSSNPSSPLIQQWGFPGDTPVTGDFDGDRKTDFAVWRPSSGTWYVIPSSNPSAPIIRQWGLAGDIPLIGDYDGDGRTDFIVWRPSNGTWYIFQSTVPQPPAIIQWGLPGDIPVIARLQRNVGSNLIVWRPSDGAWYVLQAGTNCSFQALGLPGDVPIVSQQPYNFAMYGVVSLWRPSAGFLFAPAGSCTGPTFAKLGAALDVPL
ncbi:MAG: choice-of-anchor D domain-containing protein [Bryobacteraceae bacterium]